jgi:hypothetical protein
MRVLPFSSVVVLTTDKERCSMQPIVHYVFAAALIPVATAAMLAVLRTCRRSCSRELSGDVFWTSGSTDSSGKLAGSISRWHEPKKQALHGFTGPKALTCNVAVTPR